MSLTYPQREDLPRTPQPAAITARPRYEDEILQEHMRRVHNARARRRAARQCLATRPYA